MGSALTAHVKCRPMLEYLKNRLGYGRIYNSPSREFVIQWVVGVRTDMENLIARINGHSRNAVRLAQLHCLCVHQGLPVVLPYDISQSLA